MLDLAKVKTYPIAQRKNLVTLADFVQPADSPIGWQDKDFEQLCRLVFDASRAGRTILEDGSFGMAEETGRFINETVNASTEEFGRASLHRRLLELAGG